MYSPCMKSTSFDYVFRSTSDNRAQFPWASENDRHFGSLYCSPIDVPFTLRDSFTWGPYCILMEIILLFWSNRSTVTIFMALAFVLLSWIHGNDHHKKDRKSQTKCLVSSGAVIFFFAIVFAFPLFWSTWSTRNDSIIWQSVLLDD